MLELVKLRKHIEILRRYIKILKRNDMLKNEMLKNWQAEVDLLEEGHIESEQCYENPCA